MSEQEFPPYIGITDVTTQSHDQMLVEAFMEGQHSIMADEPQGFDIGDPPDLVGQSRGWTPVHYQLAALSMCTSITITVVARDQGFAYRNLRTAVRSLIDIRGFFFDLHLQPKFEQVNYDLWLDTDADDAAIKALADESDRRCPQLGLFRLAGIPMLVTWYRKGSRRPLFEERFSMRAGRTPEDRLVATAKRAAA